MENNIEDMLSNDISQMENFLSTFAYSQMAYKLLLKQKTLKKITFSSLNSYQ